ncbi:hypothetical protein B0H14DRAFT_3871552 [Mycena olivaceomarginata]|nr:hypothetical protein B0H14DRAFT_3871552 [Mycena olivaceomarginata]
MMYVAVASDVVATASASRPPALLPSPSPAPPRGGRLRLPLPLALVIRGRRADVDVDTERGGLFVPIFRMVPVVHNCHLLILIDISPLIVVVVVVRVDPRILVVLLRGVPVNGNKPAAPGSDMAEERKNGNSPIVGLHLFPLNSDVEDPGLPLGTGSCAQAQAGTTHSTPWAASQAASARLRVPSSPRAHARRSHPTELWTPHAALRQLITRIIIIRQLPLAWARARCRRRRGLPRARRRGGISCAVGVRNRDTFASRLCMSRAGLAATGIGKMWTGKGKRVWMKSEEEDKDKGGTRGGPRGGRAADSRPKLRVGVAVRERGREFQPRVLVVLFAPPPPPSYSTTSLTSTRATGEWDAEEQVGFAAYEDAAKAARDRSSSSSSSSSSPSPSPSICAPCFYRRRYADTSPGSATRKQGGPARINAHQRGTRRGGAGFACYSLSLEYGPGVGDDTHKHTALCLRPGAPSLSSSQSAHPQTDAQPRRSKRDLESPHRTRDQIRQCSASLTRSSPSSPHLRPFSLPLLVPPLLHTVGGGTHSHTRAHKDRRHGRAEARAYRHALRRCRGAEAEWQRTAWKRSLEWRMPGRGDTEGRVGCAFGAGADVDAELQGERRTVGGGMGRHQPPHRYEYERRGCFERDA